MGGVTYLQMVSRIDIPVDRVLEKALGENLETVVICGYTQDGEEYFSSSVADGGTAVWLLERMKLMLLQEVDKRENSPDACA